MKIFNLNIGWNKPTPTQTDNRSIENFRTVNTEGMDLSQPFVDDYFNRGFSWVFFGEGNLYPQILNQLYISAPMHQSCCNFKKYSVIGNGYEWKGYDVMSVQEKIELKQFETQSKWKHATERLTLDFVKHGRAIVLLRYSKEHNKYMYARVLDPADVRNNLVDFLKDFPTRYFYSREWSRSHAQAEFTPYYAGNTAEWQVYELRNNVGGFKSYGVPDWLSSANWQKVGADIALLHKSAIENGIQPSVVYKYPYIMSPEERTAWAVGMQENAKGARNYGRAMKVESQSKDLTPDIEVIKTTDNHKLFEQTSKEYKEEVAISHNLNPALMGVRIAGSLGANEEIEFSAKQFEKIWLKSNRQKLEDFFNEISSICGIKAKLNIRETELITIAEDIMNEGVIATPSAPQQGQPTEQLSVNDALKGLSAKDNQDLMRIVRDFSKGRLAEPLARTRLLAYGIDNVTINEILAP